MRRITELKIKVKRTKEAYFSAIKELLEEFESQKKKESVCYKKNKWIEIKK